MLFLVVVLALIQTIIGGGSCGPTFTNNCSQFTTSLACSCRAGASPGECSQNHIEYFTYSTGAGFQHCGWQTDQTGVATCGARSACEARADLSVQVEVLKIDKEDALGRVRELEALATENQRLVVETDNLIIRVDRAEQANHDLNLDLIQTKRKKDKLEEFMHGDNAEKQMMLETLLDTNYSLWSSLLNSSVALRALEETVEGLCSKGDLACCRSPAVESSAVILHQVWLIPAVLSMLSLDLQ